MINDQLLRYIKQQLSLNVSKEVITTNLKSQGWTDADVGEAFTAIPHIATAPTAVPPVPTSPASSVASPVTPSITQTPTMQPQMPASSTISHPTMAQPLNSFQSPVHKSKKIIPIVVILILLGLAGGAAGYAYYTGMLSFKKTETFEQVFTKVMDKIGSQKYTKTTTEVSATLKDEKIITQLNSPAGAFPQISFSSSAVLAREDLNDPFKDKVSVNTKFNLVNILKDPILAEVDFLMPEPMIFYLKLSELSGLPEGTPSLSASLFQGKWWKMDVKELAKNFGGVEADKILESIKNSQPSKEELEKINVIFKKYLNLAHVEKLADDTIGGAPAYHFSVNFEKKQIIDMFMEISEVTRIDSVDKMEIKTPDLTAEIEKVFDMIDIKPFEILIQKRGYLPVQVKFSLEILDKEGISIAEAKMTYVTSSSEPVKIEAPAESTDILYLMGPIVQTSLESARQKGKEAAIKANMHNISVQARSFYDDSVSYSYLGFCSSKELVPFKKSIEENGGTGFVCKTKPEAYAMGVKLSESSGYWCVDSTGANKSTATLPSGTVCPVK